MNSCHSTRSGDPTSTFAFREELAIARSLDSWKENSVQRGFDNGCIIRGAHHAIRDAGFENEYLGSVSLLDSSYKRASIAISPQKVILLESEIKDRLYLAGWPADEGFNVVLHGSVMAMFNGVVQPWALTSRKLVGALDACPIPELKAKYLKHASQLLHFA